MRNERIRDMGDCLARVYFPRVAFHLVRRLTMTATDELRALLDERGVEYREWDVVHPITIWHDEQFLYEYMERTLLNGVKPHTGEVLDGSGRLEAVIHDCTPEQAIAATLGYDRLAFLERKVNLQGDYIDKLTKEKNALFTQNCEAATRHAGQMDAMQRKLEAATLGRGTCKLELATDMESIRCSACGYKLPKGTDLKATKFCGGCGCEVER